MNKNEIAFNLVSQYKECEALSDWIVKQEFSAYEVHQFKVERTVSKRVSVYIFFMDAVHKDVVMKVSAINPNHRALRKLEIVMSRWFKGEHNANAFELCVALQGQDISLATPIAYWTCGTGYARKTYFMYEKIANNSNAEQLLDELGKSDKKNAHQCADKLWIRIFSIIERLHTLGWRHGDVVPKNFLLKLPISIENLTPSDIDQLDISVIDYDKASRITNVPQWMRKIILLKDIFSFRYFGSREEKLMMDYLKIYRSLTLKIAFRVLKVKYRHRARHAKGI